MPNAEQTGAHGSAGAPQGRQYGPLTSKSNYTTWFLGVPPNGNVPGGMPPKREGSPPAHANHTAPSRSSASKTLLIVDSVRLTRECLTHLLVTELTDFEIVSIAEPQQAAQCPAWPDVVLLKARDHRSDNGNLLNDIATIYAGTHRAPVLLLSENGDAGEAAEVTDSGVASLFPSNWGAALLIAAINLVVAGGQFRAPNALGQKSAPARSEGNDAKR